MKPFFKYRHRVVYIIGGCAVLFFISIISSAGLSSEKKATPTLSHKEASNFIRAQMKRCYEEQQKSLCYHRIAIDFLDRLPLNQILNIFGAYELDTEFFKDCHQVTHYLGQEAYRRTKSVREVFRESSYICLAGAFHGAVEGYFMEKGLLGSTDAIYAKEIPHVCGKQEEYQIPQQFIECNHGMGHALMFLAENDLIRALRLCDALATPREQELCYTGAFMANATGTKDSDHPSEYAPKPEDPLYPCPLLNKRYQEQCYTYGILESFQQSLEKSAAACKLIPMEYRNACFRTLGRNRTMYSTDPTILDGQCEQIPEPDFRRECIKGIAYNLVIRFGSTSSLPDQFCKLVTLNIRRDCLFQLQNARGVTTQNEQN